MKKATGIVRKVDELGRIVIPKELRRTMDINDGDPVEIFVTGEEIILRKYRADHSCTLCGSIADDYLELGTAARICPECARLIREKLGSWAKYLFYCIRQSAKYVGSPSTPSSCSLGTGKTFANIASTRLTRRVNLSMQITINVNAPELAQAILSLSTALSAANPKPQESVMPPVQSVPSAQPINTATPQHAAQAYGAPVTQMPVGQPAPITGQTTAQVPTAPINQAPVQQAAPAQGQPAQSTVPTSAPSYDFNQIATATMQLQEAGHNIFELLSQFGIQALNQLPKERYGEYANVLRERGAKL